MQNATVQGGGDGPLGVSVNAPYCYISEAEHEGLHAAVN